jgi:hypothetical protein
MKASEARQIADNCYKEEVDYYFENIYSTEKALKDVIAAAGEGYYGNTLYFNSDADHKSLINVQENISERAVELIMGKFTDYFTELGYKVENTSTTKKNCRKDDRSFGAQLFKLTIWWKP